MSILGQKNVFFPCRIKNERESAKNLEKIFSLLIHFFLTFSAKKYIIIR